MVFHFIVVMIFSAIKYSFSKFANKQAYYLYQVETQVLNMFELWLNLHAMCCGFEHLWADTDYCRAVWRCPLSYKHNSAFV